MNALRRYFSLISRNDCKNNFELIVFITNYCNARCEHCFYTAEVNKDVPELDLESFRKLSSALPRNCNKIIFGGGEPFLREDFLEVINIFIQKGIKEYSIVTNGILTEKIIRFVDAISKIKNIKLEIAVSLDGLKDTHDKIRRHKGAFNKAFETLKSLKAKKVNVVSQTVISDLNYDEIEHFDQYIHEKLALDIHYQFIRGAKISGLPDNLRRPFNPSDVNLLPSQNDMKKFLGVMYWVYKNRITKRRGFLKSVFNFTIMECKYLIYKKKTRLFPCIAGKGMLVLYPSGEVAICEYMKPIDKKLQDFNFDFNKLCASSDFLSKQKIAQKCYCTQGCFINIVGTIKFLLRFTKNICFFCPIWAKAGIFRINRGKKLVF